MNDDMKLLTKAYFFAAQKHKNQRRKGVDAEPYINHPAEVAHILSQSGAPTHVIIAGILHDTVEDTDTSYDELVDIFGQKIADIVMEVTDDKSLPKQRRKELQVEKMPMKSADAKKVKLADKIANLRSMVASPPTEWSQQRVEQYFSWSHAVIDGGRGTCKILEKKFDQAYRDGLSAVQSRG